MPLYPASNTIVLLRLAIVAGCASIVLGMAASASAAPTEVTLASLSQALTFCHSGAMKTNDIDYVNSSDGTVQFGPGYNCAQKKATKANTKTVSTAMLVNTQSGAISECTVASAMSATTLCNAGGIGEFDIAYILGGRYKTIGGQGYGCDIVKHVGGIGNAICK